MTTYRTGNHWGVTIVREGEDCDCRVDESSLNRLKFHQGCTRAEAQLVAVVTNGDRELAERICALLNRDERVDGMWCETCERQIRPGDTYAFAPGTGGLVHCGQHAANLGELRVRASDDSARADGYRTAIQMGSLRAPAAECTVETRSWDHFTPEQMDSYWIRCTLLGPHDEHEDDHTGLKWRTDPHTHGGTE